MRIIVITTSIIMALSSCLSFEGLQPKQAVFNKPTEELIEELKSKHDFEDVGVKWTVSIFDTDTTHNLKLFLVNGDLPDNEDSLQEIGIQMMHLLIESIDNENDYEDFVVTYVTQRKVGAINQTMEHPFVYTLEEIKTYAP